MTAPVFHYQLPGDTVFFTDSIRQGTPFVFGKPRDHESIFIVTNGALGYEKNGHYFVVAQGQVGYISRGSVDISSAHECAQVSYIATNFFFDKQNLTPTLPFSTLCSAQSAYRYERLFEQGLNHFLSQDPGYLTICNGLLMQIIGLLYNEYRVPHADFKKMQRLREPVNYLKLHFSDPDFRISRLSDMVGLSEKHFRRLFMDAYHMTPYQFLLDFRIRNAEALLSNTSKSISDIAVQCGFSDVYSFSHSFKTHIGVSPAHYRNHS